MIDSFFTLLVDVENLLWGYLAVPLIMLVGIYLSFQSNFIQIRKFPVVVRTFFSFLKKNNTAVTEGVPPLKAFFACVGGCVGIGNIVGICTAVQIGGPGALFWIWVTAIVGSMLKYAEVYLGLKYRVVNEKGEYSGGPMYFLKRVFKTSWIPNIVCLFLCIYGVEIYQFSVVVNSVSTNLEINPYIVIFILLGLVIFAGSGGVNRVGSISSAIIPGFVLLYVGMGFWVFVNHLSELPSIFNLVIQSAFSGHAALGGFTGSTLILTMSQGVRRGCYTGDLGVGYASVIHSESSVKIPEKQASLVIFDIFIDTFLICTTSVMLILVTGLWNQPMEAGLLVQYALGQYFPGMHYFMPFFLFLLGYSTINAYFCVGLKCAQYLSPRYGRSCFYVYAVISLLLFSLFDTAQALSVMTVANGCLLVFNCYGIYRLRHEVSYDFSFADAKPVPIVAVAPVMELNEPVAEP
jgi:alanine or glycine:cation symporter, AGCS family